jgi:hypothetical protein
MARAAMHGAVCDFMWPVWEGVPRQAGEYVSIDYHGDKMIKKFFILRFTQSTL